MIDYEINNRIAYFYDDAVGNFFYAAGHPMKPHRIKMAHNLIMAYNLHKYMRCLTPIRASESDLARFHSGQYIRFLKYASPDLIMIHQINSILTMIPLFLMAYMNFAKYQLVAQYQLDVRLHLEKLI